VHGHEAYGAFATPAIQRRHREALQAAQHVIAVSDEIRNRLVEALGLDPRRVTTIHNGIDVQKFPLQAREDARRNLGLPVNKRLLLTVARLSPEKRLDLLIDAAAACDRQLDWQFHIVGEGPEHARLQRQIAGLGLQNRILLERGVPHEQLVDWYRSADVFCLSSRNEGCPVVVIEALACGVPVVSTAVGAVPDLVSEPDEGLLCPAGDVAALTQRIGQALRSDWNHERIAERGRQRTWDAVVAQTLPLYHPSGD
jgi:glycosyltransferase involved in cell wall biosynthesis